MSLGSWRVSTRIAARTAWRAKGRTLLIGAMVGLPMMGIAAADTLYRTADLTIEQKVQREYGGADYVVTNDPQAQVLTPWMTDAPESEVDRSRVRERGIASLRDAGAKPVLLERNGMTMVDALDSSTDLTLTDLRSPLTDDIFVRRTGRSPEKSDEVVITPDLATSAGASIGDSLVLNGTTVRVVGTAVTPGWVHGWKVIALPNTVIEQKPKQRLSQLWLVDRPALLTEAEFVAVLDDSGLAFRSHDEIVATAKAFASSGPIDANAAGTAVVVVGLAGLQIVLLASAAFAVGARRQRRDLGLIAAQGGDRRQVRRVVLASAVVIGAAASVVGIVLGVGLAAVLRRPLENQSGELFGPFEIAPLDLLAVVVIGTVTALLAAALPARTASRIPVLAALTGRRGQVSMSHRATVAGVVGIVAGFLTATAGATAPANYNLILGGAVIAELGFALCAAALIGLAGRTAQWFPLPLRLALRDSSRNRGRSAPAVAAVMAALAATVGLSVFLVSDEARSRELYQPSLPANVLLTYAVDQYKVPEATTLKRWEAASVEVAKILPGGRAHRIDQVDDVYVRQVSTYTSGDIAATTQSYVGDRQVAVGDATTAGVLAGVDPGPEIQAALDRGEVVALGRHGDTAELVLDAREGGRERVITVPSVGLGSEDFDAMPGAVVSPQTAERLGASTQPSRGIWTMTEEPTSAQLRAATAAMVAQDLDGSLERAEPYESDIGLILLGLVGVSVVVTLGATAIATGLAGTEARADLATLAAVGASPRVRRALSMGQAASIAGLGAVLGLFAGLVPAYAILQAREEYPFVVPWTLVAAVVVGVPLVAALLAGLFTRSRLPMQARFE